MPEYRFDAISEVATLNFSTAKVLLDKSPLHAWLQHPRLNPDYMPDIPSADMELGTILHALVLEGRHVYAEIDADNYRTKAAQEERDAARASGKIPILAHQLPDIRAASDAAIAYLRESTLHINMPTGNPEHAVYWEHNGIRCRSKLDLWLPDKGIILDYKTTGLSQGSWLRGIYTSHLDMQAAMYMRSVGARDFYWLVQETEPPYSCYLVGLSPTMRETGLTKFEQAARIWQACLDADKWPGYDLEPIYVDPPAYALADAENLRLGMDNWDAGAFLMGRVNKP